MAFELGKDLGVLGFIPEKGSHYAASLSGVGGVLFTTGKDLSSLVNLLEYGRPYFVQSNPLFSPNCKDLSILLQLIEKSAPYFVSRPPIFSSTTVSRAKVLEVLVLPLGAPGAYPLGREFAFDLSDLSSGEVTVPINTSGRSVEVIFPVVPLYRVDKDLTQYDSMEWRRNSRAANQTLNLLRFRARFDEYVVLVDFLERYRLQRVTLYTPGIRPFGRNYVRSYVYPLSYTSVRESEKLYLIDASFQFLAGIA